MSLQRRAYFNQISRILRPKPNRKWLLGWRSIRFENTISLHIFTVCWLLFWSVLHVFFALFLFYLRIYNTTIPHSSSSNSTIIAAQSLAGVKKSDDGFFDMFRDKKVMFEKPDADQFMLGTGLSIALLFGIISANAIPVIRKKFFELFYVTHHFFLLAIVAYVFHCKGLKLSWAIPIGIYLVDRLYRIAVKRRVSSVTARRWSKGIIELRIPITPKQLKKYLFERDIFGKYIYLNCRALSMIQWHPFDVASTIDDGYISVYISVNSGWSLKLSKKIFGTDRIKDSRLKYSSNEKFSSCESPPTSSALQSATSTSELEEYNRASKQTYKEIDNISIEYKLEEDILSNRTNKFINYGSKDLIISGINDSMTKYVIENNVAMLVCGGTGLAPMISIVKYFIRNIGDKKKIKHLKHVYLVWSTREYSSFFIMEETISEIISRDLQSLVKIFIHYTGDDKLLSPRLNAQHVFHTLPAIVSTFVRIIPGRQDVYSLIEAATTENPGCTYGLASVGSKSLVKNARRTTNAWNRSFPFMLKVNYYEGKHLNSNTIPIGFNYFMIYL
ncbi:hypothetical protein BB560_002937 [Smittium megazygosporum]|uniref:FAD-binding FR-type domain-containing protein n=1 Tax=Smittium megazygosporum TaxID=133381 RepID=A0A2T9ZDF2_9FUNG|nr:hypothetical protein BB560_002937 [Smittium megazygosporum]